MVPRYNGLYTGYYESDFDETRWKCWNLGPINDCMRISSIMTSFLIFIVCFFFKGQNFAAKGNNVIAMLGHKWQRCCRLKKKDWSSFFRGHGSDDWLSLCSFTTWHLPDRYSAIPGPMPAGKKGGVKEWCLAHVHSVVSHLPSLAEDSRKITFQEKSMILKLAVDPPQNKCENTFMSGALSFRLLKKSTDYILEKNANDCM